MVSVVEDQRLGFFPRSSRSPTRWCPVSRGQPHSDCSLVQRPLRGGSCALFSRTGLLLPWLLSHQYLKWAPSTTSSERSTRMRHPLRYRFPVLALHLIGAKGLPHPVPPPPLPQPSSPCTPHRCQGCQGLISQTCTAGSPLNSRLFKPRFTRMPLSCLSTSFTL